MEIYKGEAHLPGAHENWHIRLELEWQDKEVNVHIDEEPDGISDWPGLVVQTFGTEEIVFRTKGIPGAFTHWWHFVRGGTGDLWGMVLGLPDVDGIWRTCPLTLYRTAD